MAALLGVLGSGPANGVLLGAMISIGLLLRQAARPRVVELGRIPGTVLFGDLARNPGNQSVPGVLVCRVEASLLYFNADYVRERLLHLLSARAEPVRLVILYLGTVPNVDLAGAQLIRELHRALARRGIALRLADIRGNVRDALHRTGFDNEYGTLESGQTVDIVLNAWQRANARLPAGATV
jgi:MFS superfamily sulfate permease-like transporter